MSCTFCFDHFLTGLKGYVHKERTQAPELKAKVMRYQNPIVAIKQCKRITDKKDIEDIAFANCGLTTEKYDKA
jgi:hypothetical protein